jgi:hypothetical protein
MYPTCESWWVGKGLFELSVARTIQLCAPNFVFFYQFIDIFAYCIQRISKSKILQGPFLAVRSQISGHCPLKGGRICRTIGYMSKQCVK